MIVDENNFFREVTLRICGSLDIEEALSHVFEYIKNYIPADAIGLGFSDLDSEHIRVVAKFARRGGVTFGRTVPLKLFFPMNRSHISAHSRTRGQQ
jgi:hypothetical protein